LLKITVQSDEVFIGIVQTIVLTNNFAWSRWLFADKGNDDEFLQIESNTKGLMLTIWFGIANLT